MANLVKLSKVEKKAFFTRPWGPLQVPKKSIKNISRFSMETNTSFYSEFNADPEYGIIFEKYSWWKNDFSIVLPFLWILSLLYWKISAEMTKKMVWSCVVFYEEHFCKKTSLKSFFILKKIQFYWYQQK